MSEALLIEVLILMATNKHNVNCENVAKDILFEFMLWLLCITCPFLDYQIKVYCLSRKNIYELIIQVSFKLYTTVNALKNKLKLDL